MDNICKNCKYWEQMYTHIEAFGYCHCDKIYSGQFEAPKRDELKFLVKEEGKIIAGCDFSCKHFTAKENIIKEFPASETNEC
jgi:hypothetical protein